MIFNTVKGVSPSLPTLSTEFSFVCGLVLKQSEFGKPDDDITCEYSQERKMKLLILQHCDYDQ